MKRVLSAMAFVVLSSSTLIAQAPPDSATRASFIVRVRRTSDGVLAAQTLKSPTDSGRSHAMRNGAIVGAAAGLVAGIVGSTYLNFGCVDTNPNCSERRSEWQAAITLGITGSLAGALVGAVTGKVVSLVRR